MMKGCGWVSLYVVYVYCRLGLESYRKKMCVQEDMGFDLWRGALGL